MLGVDHASGVIPAAWLAAPERARLPPGESERAFFSASGPVPGCFDSRRVHHRFYFRRRALLVSKDGPVCRGRPAGADRVWGVFACDISRSGVSLLCPRQLYPDETATLAVFGESRAELLIERCRRLDRGCYRCGGRFTRAGGVAALPRLPASVAEAIAKAAR